MGSQLGVKHVEVSLIAACYPGCALIFLRHNVGKDCEPATIECMLLGTFAIRLLEGMFFVGLLGSSVVVLISFFEDAKELFGDE
jgi:hypothetical protein